MRQRNQTTVVLSDFVQKIRNQLAPIYGLKNTLSAGILLFSRLSAEDQKKIIAEINSDDKVICDTKLVLMTEQETKDFRDFQAEMLEPPKKKHKKA